MMSCQEWRGQLNFIEKLTVSDIRRFCERLSNFTTYDLGSSDVWGPGSEPWRSLLNPPLQSNPKVTILPSKLFMTLALYNKTTLCTAETWLKVTIISFLNLKNFFCHFWFVCKIWHRIHHVSKNWGHFYFLNNSVKHWPILVMFGKQHREETWHIWL